MCTFALKGEGCVAYLLHFIQEQEAMENFVFPDEIKAKLIKMNEEHFFTIQKLKRPLRIPQNRTKENKLNQIRSQKI